MNDFCFPKSLLEEHKVRLLLKGYHIRAEICAPPQKPMKSIIEHISNGKMCKYIQTVINIYKIINVKHM